MTTIQEVIKEKLKALQHFEEETKLRLNVITRLKKELKQLKELDIK